MQKKKINIKDKLPSYKAPDIMWSNIEEQLNSLDKELMNNTIANKLPMYAAPDLFDSIAPPTKIKSISLNWLYVAASIVLLIGFGFGFKQFSQRTKTQITYSVELHTTNTINAEIELTTIDDDFNTVLSYKCQTMPKVCQLPDYKELRKQLNELEQEQQNLKQALEQYKSTELEGHLVRLTNDKIKLENYILNLFS